MRVTVAAGAAGAVYVADADVHRVQKFTVDDSVAPPPPPTGLSVDPASPGTSLTPKIIGTAGSGTRVKIYTGSTCSGAPLAEGSAAVFAGAGIPVTVASASTTTFYATATNRRRGRHLQLLDQLGHLHARAAVDLGQRPSLTRGGRGHASRFDVTLSMPSDATVKVDYTTVNGTAVSAGRLQRHERHVTFTPGQTTKPVLVHLQPG